MSQFVDISVKCISEVCKNCEDPMQVCGDLLLKWFQSKKGHHEARWKKKWSRFIKRCWYD